MTSPVLTSQSEFTSEPPVDPLAPIEQLAHWLAGAAGAALIGLVLGYGAAYVLRRGRLRWTWAAVPLVLVVLARPVLGGHVTLTLTVAALSACRWGRRWHREDLEAGVDMRDLAERRRGPSEIARVLIGRFAPGRAGRRPRAWRAGGRLAVGCECDGRVVTIPLGAEDGGRHTLVVGATRSGKTVTMTWMAVRAVERGMGVVALDPKGDRDLRRALCEVARREDRRLLEWSPRGGSTYNPYAGGSETEIVDKALAGERFTEPHYLRQAQRYLGHAVRVLRGAGLEVSPRSLVEHLDPSRLELLARAALPEREAQSTYEYLDSLTARQSSDLAGVRDRLAIMAESDVGALLDPETAGTPRLDLDDAVRRGAVVYFNLEADRRPLLAQMLGAAIVQDLQATIATLQRTPIPTLVLLDEFSAIVPERVVGLFARAAGAGVNLVLGTQELADLRPPGRETLLEQVMGNLSTLIAHRQVVPASASLIASLSETRGAWRSSCHSDGRTTRTRVLENVLRAEQVMSLPCGWAAVVALSDGGAVGIARMFNVTHER